MTIDQFKLLTPEEQAALINDERDEILLLEEQDEWEGDED